MIIHMKFAIDANGAGRAGSEIGQARRVQVRPAKRSPGQVPTLGIYPRRRSASIILLPLGKAPGRLIFRPLTP